ncbi:MAG TPA: methyltransferase domain-containing protein [Candidatus Methanoperedens sp.]
MSGTIEEAFGAKPKSMNSAQKIETVFEKIIHRFESKDIMRISIATGSSGVLDKYIDKRQKEIVSKYLSGDKQGYFLDAGMGAGRWTDFLCMHSEEEIGVDISKKMLIVARANTRQKNSSYIVCSNTNLPFKDNTFNFSFSCFSLLYLVPYTDFNKAVEELVRVTKPDQKIIIIDITARKPAVSALIHRRTSSQYIETFSKYGAALENIEGCYVDYPVRGYQFILKRIFRLFFGSSFHSGTNIWDWVEEKGENFKTIIQLPLKLIIFVMYPGDKLLAGTALQPICPEKVFIFRKKDHRNIYLSSKSQ